DNIVGLPLARRKAGVGQGRILAVDGTSRTVGVGLVAVGIEHLDFVSVQPEEDAAIAAALAFALRRHGRSPFDVQLAITEVLQRANVAAAFDALHVAPASDPLGRATIHADPL